MAMLTDRSYPKHARALSGTFGMLGGLPVIGLQQLCCALLHLSVRPSVSVLHLSNQIITFS